MKKKNVNFKNYLLKCEKDDFTFNFLAINDDVAKLNCRKYLSEFDFKSASLYLITNYDPVSLLFVSKVFPFKRTHVKGVNLWTGKKSYVPVSSPHLVLSCAYCNYFLDDNAPICRYCDGCLDCRNRYKYPFTQVITFNELLDRIESYVDLPF